MIFPAPIQKQGFALPGGSVCSSSETYAYTDLSLNAFEYVPLVAKISLSPGFNHHTVYAYIYTRPAYGISGTAFRTTGVWTRGTAKIYSRNSLVGSIAVEKDGNLNLNKDNISRPFQIFPSEMLDYASTTKIEGLVTVKNRLDNDGTNANPLARILPGIVLRGDCDEIVFDLKVANGYDLYPINNNNYSFIYAFAISKNFSDNDDN